MALAVSVTFLLLAVWHIYMALSPSNGHLNAVPSTNGKPLFIPSKAATLVVACILILFAVLTAATGKLLLSPIPVTWLSWSCYLLAVGLLARAVGEFKYVGFFKRVRGTRFARLDSFIYSPLCLVLAFGVAWVAVGSR